MYKRQGVDAATLTFTPADWNQPQQVQVTAVDDTAVEASPHAGYVQFATSSLDPAFDAVAVASIAFDITDDDVASAAIDLGDGLLVDEAGATSDTFTVRLDNQPSAPVLFTVTSDAQVTASPATFAFTTDNWNVPRAITVTAVDDLDDEANLHPGVVTLTPSRADPFFAVIAPLTATADVHDDESFGSATAAFAGIVEGAGAQYQHASGSTIWFNPGHAGSFSMVATGTAAPSLESIGFPGLVTAGWSPTLATTDTSSPYTRAYSWSAGALAGRRSTGSWID